MKNLVWFIVLSFIVQGCVFSNCKKKDLPKSEKAWFRNYKLGQKYVYESNQNRTDTLLVVDLMDDYTPCNKFELSEYQYNVMILELKSYLFRENTYLNFGINEMNQVERGINFIDLYGFYVDDELNECSNKIKLDQFSDSLAVYTFDHSNAKSEGKGIIQSFSWSREHGIVRYETTEGEVFELVK